MTLARMALVAMFIAIAAVGGACGSDGDSTEGESSTRQYMRQLDRALDDLAAGLEESGNEGDDVAVEEAGLAVWQAFQAELGSLTPPGALEEEHAAFVEAVDDLSTDSSTDGLVLADRMTQACLAIEAKASTLGTDENLSCE